MVAEDDAIQTEHFKRVTCLVIYICLKAKIKQNEFWFMRSESRSRSSSGYTVRCRSKRE